MKGPIINPYIYVTKPDHEPNPKTGDLTPSK
jgi:hypothetical protein